MSETFLEVHGFVPPGSQLFLTHWRLLPVLWARPLFLRAPESWRCHVAVWEGTYGALLLELGHGTMAAIMWAVLQAYMCLGVCNCERESQGGNLPLASLPYKMREVMLQSSSFNYFDLKLCSPLP